MTSDLSEHLMSQVTSTVPLEVRPSSISGAKKGLFTTAAIQAGEEIFRSNPLIACVDDGLQDAVCDYCFSYTKSMILPNGNFRQTVGDSKPLKMTARRTLGEATIAMSARLSASRRECLPEHEPYTGFLP
ncbi:hypothetical protein BJX96DRAFT_135819 [Aspergillus floccosus]